MRDTLLLYALFGIKCHIIKRPCILSNKLIYYSCQKRLSSPFYMGMRYKERIAVRLET